MATTSSMRQLEERHIATVVESMVWCNKMDLLALCNVRGEVSLHRLTWQKVWTLPPPEESVKVLAMAWRPDGKVLAVGYSNQEVSLVDIENGEIIHVQKVKKDVSCLAWVDELEQSWAKPPSVANQYRDLSGLFLPTLPSLSRNFGPMNKGTEENAEDSKKIGDQKRVNILLIGTKDGHVLLSAFGLFHCGEVQVSDHVGGLPCEVMNLDMCRKLDVLVVVVAVGKDSENSENSEHQLGVVLIGTSVLANHSEQLLLVSKLHGNILSLLTYMAQTMASITEAWEKILMEMDTKLARYALTVPPGSVSADFLDLLMLGTPSEDLEYFLLHTLTEKGLKKLGHSIELSYSNIQKLVLKHLQAVGQNILYHLAELRGMSRCKDSFDSLGIEENLVVSAMTAASAFMTKATEVQQVIDNSMRNYKAFFRWLYVAILRLSEERLPPEITKIRQQDLAFIAEFLENFDGFEEDDSETKEDEEACSSTKVKKPSFKLERLGQYLVDEDLKVVVEKSDNQWLKFLDESDAVAINPSILPRFEKMSLVQQHKHLINEIETLFTKPSATFKSQFGLLGAASLFKVSDPNNIVSSCNVSTAEQKFSLAFLHAEESTENFHFVECPLKSNDEGILVCKNAQFMFSSTQGSPHKVVDLQFFTEDIISMLLEQTGENRTAVFVQLPTKIAREQSKPLAIGQTCADSPLVDAVPLLEVNTLRVMENLVASRFAVNGTRKVAVVLSESRRRVRLFEMEVDAEDEEEEDETMDATKESDSSQQAETSTDQENQENEMQ